MDEITLIEMNRLNRNRSARSSICSSDLQKAIIAVLEDRR